ncbi:MAG: OB-fold nucleic acid binding domain-containing protein, partial [Clostridia bacterium]
AGAFADLFDFCRRVDKRTVNRRVVEALVRAGAFDSIDPQRSKLLASVGRALEGAEQAERAASQVSLFGEAEAPRGGAQAYVDAPPWDLKQKLLEEKAALGYSLSAHLFSVYERELTGFPRTPLARLAPSESRVWMAGVVAAARTQMTRRGRMIVVMLDDGTAQVEITVFNELFEKHRDKLKEDALLVVAGKAQNDQFSGNFRVIAEDLLDLELLRSRYAARLRIAMNGGADAKRLQQLLAPYRSGNGGCTVVVSYQNSQAGCDVALGESWRVRPDPRLISDLGAWLTPANVQVLYSGL